MPNNEVGSHQPDISIPRKTSSQPDGLRVIRTLDGHGAYSDGYDRGDGTIEYSRANIHEPDASDDMDLM